MKSSLFGNDKRHVIYMIFVLVLLVYLPTYNFAYYVYHDDWYFQSAFLFHPLQHPTGGLLFRLGRPLQAVLVTIFESGITNIYTASIVRFILCVAVASFGVLLYTVMKNIEKYHGKDYGIATAFAAIAVVLLPEFVTYVGYIANGTIAVSLLAALLSYHLASTATTSKSKLFACYLYVCAYFLLEISQLIYQGGVTIYFVPFAVHIILINMHNRRLLLDTLIKTSKIIALGLVAMLSYLVYFKLAWRGEYAHFGTSIWQVLNWYIIAMQTAFSLYLVPSARFLSYFILGFLLAGISILEINRTALSNIYISISHILVKYTLIIFLLIAAGGVCAIGSPDSFVYRTSAPLGALVCLLFIYTFLGFQFYRLMLTSLIVCAVLSSNYIIVNYIINPVSFELVYIKKCIKGASLSKLKEIHVIVAPRIINGSPLNEPSNGLSEFQYGDEFGCGATAFPQDIYGIVRALLHDIGGDAISKRVKIIESVGHPKIDEKLKSTDDVLVIDMRKLINPGFENLFIQGESVKS